MSVREAYDYLAGVTSEIGQSAWIATSILLTEAMICVKFGWETITLPFPGHIKLFWFVILSIYLLWSFWPLWKVDITTEKPTEESDSLQDRDSEKEKDE